MALVWFTQFRAFLCKVLLQLKASLFSTLFMLLLPGVLVLALVVGYRSTSIVYVPAAQYVYGKPVNASSVFEDHFCLGPEAPYELQKRLRIPTCYVSADEFACIPTVLNGSLCVLYPTLARESISQLFTADGPVVVPSLDAYLGLSAFVTHRLRRDNPRLFGRTAEDAMGHFGKLLLVGSRRADRDGAVYFRDFCSGASVLCGEVLGDLPIFDSMAAARRYTMDNDGEVWAIADFTSDHDGDPGVGVHERHFTISMNYSATPWTTETTIPLAKAVAGNSGLLYVTSGFLTLQNAIQQSYVQQRAVGWRSGSRIFKYANMYGPTTVTMPSSSHLKSSFYDMGHYTPLLIVVATLVSAMAFAGLIVSEKAEGIRGCMELMGLRWSAMALCWLVVALLMDLIAVCLPVFLMGFTFFHYVSLGVLFVVHISFLQQIRALCLLLSTFFRRSWLVKLALCAVFLSCVVPYCGMSTSHLSSEVKFTSLLPCVGYLASFGQLIQHASTNRVYGWKDAVEGDNSVALLVGMTWTSAVVMLVLWSYLDQVLPSSSCRRKHALFPLRALCHLFRRSQAPDSERCGIPWRGRSKEDLPPSMKHVMDQHPEYLDTENHSVAAVFCGLRKRGRRHGCLRWGRIPSAGGSSGGMAVDDVSCVLEFGKVAVLIGPSGCGKSTLMDMAAGAVTPDAGSIYTCGRSADDNPEGRCRSVGYCPQVDVLWDGLTVEEHLTFYARMKSGGICDVRGLVVDVINTLQLEAQCLTRAKYLSRGQRRRLCVGIALIGDPTLLLLDDPMAGMDVKGRRAIRDALNKGREGRAVLIATHELEQAEHLGDHIHVMQDGVMRDSGTPLVLKSKVSVGYVLTCVVNPGVSLEEEGSCVDRLIDCVRGATPDDRGSAPMREDATVSYGVGLLGVERRGRQVSFRFPLSLLSSDGLCVVRELQSRRSELCLQSIGLSIATLQDALDYLAIQRQPTTVPNGNEAHGTCGPALGEVRALDCSRGNGSPTSAQLSAFRGSVDDDRFSNTFGYGQPDWAEGQRSEPHQTFLSHFVALLLKRLREARWDAQLVLFYVVMPLVLVLVSLPIGRVKPASQPALTLDPSMYSIGGGAPNSTLIWTYSYVLDAFGVQGSDMHGAFGPHYALRQVTCFEGQCFNVLSNTLYENMVQNKSRVDVALSLTDEMHGVLTSVAMHNISSPHAIAQSINALYNVVNHQLFGGGSTMTARNDPMPMGPHEEEVFLAFYRVIAALFVILAFVLIPANVVGRIVREVQCGAYHLQCLAGANMLAFWSSAMLFDFLCYMVTEVLVFVVLFASGCDELVGDSETITASITLFSMFGLCAIPFSYVLSFLFKSPRGARNTVLAGGCMFGIVWILVEPLAMRSQRVAIVVMGVTGLLRIIPWVAFSEAVMAMIYTRLAMAQQPHRERLGLFSPLDHNENGLTGGIGTGLVYMACTFVACLSLFTLLELLRRRGVVFRLLPCAKGDGEGENGASALRSERKRRNDGESAGGDWRTQEEMVSHPNRERTDGLGAASGGLSLQHVSKKYASTSSLTLHDLSLAVLKGEKVAVLGFNDAGKSTVLSILVGRVRPTTGSACVGETVVRPNAPQSSVGYCPQDDALLDNLTPYEHLFLFSKLRGATGSRVEGDISQLLSTLGLEEVRGCLVRSLTPSQRRRLSVAIAFVGGTTSLLLDEPTTDMDVVSRRQVFTAVQRLGKSRTVVLASRHLDEMEVLADRTVFIERGHLRYVGTPQELRSHFTHDVAYVVGVVFGNTVASQLDPLGGTVRMLCECFDKPQGSHGCRVKSVVGRTVTVAVMCDLLLVCERVVAVSEGAIPNLPQVVQVSVTQPQLDDALLDF